MEMWNVSLDVLDMFINVEIFQSRYFDCEYDKNEHEKTDGGLGAGTPMFISEVMQDSGCVLL